MHKKGVSPLIAAVMLIGFAIVIGTFVSTFIIAKVKQTNFAAYEDSPYCEQTVLEIVTDPAHPDNFKIEGSGDAFTVKGLALKNKGTFSVYGIVLNAPGKGTQKARYKPEDVLKPGSLNALATAGIPFAGGTETKLTIIPEIKDPESETVKYIVCSKAASTMDLKTACCSKWKGAKDSNGVAIALSTKCSFPTAWGSCQ